MKNQLTNKQIESYRENGFIIIEDFLTPQELDNWRSVVTNALNKRAGKKFPNQTIQTGENDGINIDSEYYSNVFDQILNLWQSDEKVKELILDERIGEMACKLSQSEGIRVWHDQALIKKPWSNPTAWHLDTPYWSFESREALSIWVALEDATLENGCLFFIPGSHKTTTFENVPISKNMNAIFDIYPQFKTAKSIAAPMKAGSCSFHNGLTIHGAHANMTPGYRKAFTCAFMPADGRFNGKKNILTDEQFSKLKVGDIISDDKQNPIVYSTKK